MQNTIRLWLLITFLIGVLFLSACEDEVGEPPPPHTISEHLSKIFYWGRIDDQNWGANEGDPRGEITHPAWLSESDILVVSATLTNSEEIRGVFKLSLDPSTLTFGEYAAYRFNDFIWRIRYDRSTDRLVFIYVDGVGGSHIAEGQLAGEYLTTIDELVEPDWVPSGLSYWPGQIGIVFYGINPTDKLGGFYWRTGTAAESLGDSLIYATEIDSYAARAFTINRSGDYLIYGVNTYQNGTPGIEIYKLKLDLVPRIPEMIAERTGELTAIESSPTDSSIVLLNYACTIKSSITPNDHVVIVNIDDLSAIDLDINTTETSSEYAGAAFPSFNPTSDVFVFTAWNKDDLGIRQTNISLWMYDMR